MKAVAAAIQALTQQEIFALMKAGSVTVCGEVLTLEGEKSMLSCLLRALQ
jgi:hypothetical protein